MSKLYRFERMVLKQITRSRKTEMLKIFVLVISVLLNGCAAAALPLVVAATAVPVGVTAWSVTKMVQTSHGKFEVAFKDDELNSNAQESLQAISSVGIWPSFGRLTVEVGGAALLAQKLEKTEKLKIITPHEIETALKESGTTNIDELMTESEKVEVLKKIGVRLNADGIMVFHDEGTSMNQNLFSFKASEYRRHFSLKVYSVQSGKLIYSTEVKLIQKGGEANKATEGEIKKIVATEIANHFLEAIGRAN